MSKTAKARRATRIRLSVVLAAMAGAAALIAVGAVAVWPWLSKRIGGGPYSPAIESIAVLPFDNLSGDPQQEHLADGMTDALISSLSQIRALRVISRTSSMDFKGVHGPLSEISQALGADAIVEGSVVRSGGHVVVRAKLIDTSEERQLWADEYQRQMEDVLTLHGEVARTIARQIGIALALDEEARLTSKRPVVAEAYSEYIKGI